MTQDVLPESALTAAGTGLRRGCVSPKLFARVCLRTRSERMPVAALADEGRVAL